MPSLEQTPAPAPQLDRPAQGQPVQDQPEQAVQSAGSGQPLIESDAPLAVAATPTEEDEQLSREIREKNQAAMSINYNHMRVLQPAGSSDGSDGSIDGTATDGQTASQNIAVTVTDQAGGNIATNAPAEPPVTRTPDPAILEFANNDDLDIATIARQANKEIKKSPDEVEIRLH